MKKKIILLIIIFLSLLVSLLLNINFKTTTEKLKETNELAVILKDESNNETTSSSFPSKTDYILEKVICDGEQIEATDTGISSFNINLTGITKTSKCTYYFIVDNFEYTETFTYTVAEPTTTWIVPKTGNYIVELWGASGNIDSGGYNSIDTTGQGAYVSGKINLTINESLIFNIATGNLDSIYGGNNGGGSGGNYNSHGSGGGGGATDIRINGSDLKDRIMVAAGGGGCASHDIEIPHAGGLTGYNSRATNYTRYGGNGGTQTTGGTVPSNYSGTSGLTSGGFGFGGNGNKSVSTGVGSGGGSGYYGGSGGSGAYSGSWGGGGGSSYISGHKGCVAIQGSAANPSAPLTPRTGTGGVACTTGINDQLCSVHYSGKVFANTKMIDGTGLSWTNTKGSAEAMPNPLGGTYPLNTGHIGNGYVRITYMD